MSFFQFFLDLDWFLTFKQKWQKCNFWNLHKSKAKKHNTPPKKKRTPTKKNTFRLIRLFPFPPDARVLDDWRIGVKALVPGRLELFTRDGLRMFQIPC